MLGLQLWKGLVVVVVEAISVVTTVRRYAKEKTGELKNSAGAGGYDSQQTGVPPLPLTSTDAFICPHLPSLLLSLFFHPSFPFSVPVPFLFPRR